MESKFSVCEGSLSLSFSEYVNMYQY